MQLHTYDDYLTLESEQSDETHCCIAFSPNLAIQSGTLNWNCHYNGIYIDSKISFAWFTRACDLHVRTLRWRATIQKALIQKALIHKALFQKLIRKTLVCHLTRVLIENPPRPEILSVSPVNERLASHHQCCTMAPRWDYTRLSVHLMCTLAARGLLISLDEG